MRIVHDISVRVDEHDREILGLLGIDAKQSELVVVTVDEADPNWPAVARWVDRRSCPPHDSCSTEFTEEEVAAARWLRLNPTWEYGYPQPEDGYKEATFGGTGCAKCSVGRVQQAPFRIRGEPRWGRRGIFQLNWDFDEYFVKLDVWETVFRSFGVASRPVLGRRGPQILQSVVQLVAAERAPVEIAGPPLSVCSVCGRPKYRPHRRGFFPALASEPAVHLFKTAQWFGDGGVAFQETIVSRDLMRAFLAHGVRGAKAWPLADAQSGGLPREGPGQLTDPLIPKVMG